MIGRESTTNDLRRRISELELERVKQERDALAAHVEAQNSVLENASAMGFFTICYDSGVDHTQLCRKVAALQKETPATSLARRDLLKQAEVLEEMSSMVNPDNPGRSLIDEAKRLRRQAKEIN